MTSSCGKETSLLHAKTVGRRNNINILKYAGSLAKPCVEYLA